MKRIVFVCSGNICRSPMAAGLARDVLTKQKVAHMVISAGTLNIQGQPASKNAVEAMRLIGLDIEGHRSQGASRHLMGLADKLVVMSPGHEKALLEMDPALAPKIQRMWSYAKPPGRLDEIEDPVGQDLDAFIACRDELVACIDEWARQLVLLGTQQ